MYHFYDFDIEKKSERKGKDLKTSIENLTLDFFKETKRRDRSYSKRSKRKGKEKKSKVTSDEGFEELEGKYNDSDASTVDTTNIISDKNNEKSKVTNKLKNPFQGYLFKEDIETLRKTYENERNKTELCKDKTQTSGQPDALNKSNVNDEPKDNDNSGVNKSKNADCDCYEKEEKIRNINLEEETLTFTKAKEEFKRQMNFTGMIYR